DPRVRVHGEGPNDIPTGPREHHYWLVRKLVGLLGSAGCHRYAAWLVPGGDVYGMDLEYKGACPPTNPTREEEMAALHVAIEWLKPVPDYPRFATAKQREELLELRRRVVRTATNRLRQLEGETARAGPIAGGQFAWDGRQTETLTTLQRSLLEALWDS